MWLLRIDGSVSSTRGSKHRSTIPPTIAEVCASISFADRICSASANETSSNRRVPSLPTTYWYLTWVAISRKKPSDSSVKPSGHGEPDHVDDVLPTPVSNWRENERGGMPSRTAPPTGTNTLVSGAEATAVETLAATNGDRISTTNGRFVNGACTTANALVVVGQNGGGHYQGSPLTAPL